MYNETTNDPKVMLVLCQKVYQEPELHGDISGLKRLYYADSYSI